MLRDRIKNGRPSRHLPAVGLFQAAGNRALIEFSPLREGTFAANGLLSDGSESLFRYQTTSTAPVFRYSFNDVMFDPELTMFSSHGAPIRDVLYTQPPAVLDLFCAHEDRPIESCDQTAWAGFDHWNTNFYHWVAHTLPAIRHFLKAAGPDDVFLLPALTPWQTESIELMGLARKHWKITHAGTRYRFPRVIYTDFIRGRTDFTASETAVETSHMLRHAAGCVSRPGSRLLFIERGEAANRKIPNEAELASGLKQIGFECIRPETLSVREQIRLFSEARMVIGFLGAGMTNISWCPPASVVYELVPSHHQNPCFLPIAVRNRLYYWADLIETGVTQEDHTSQAVLPVNAGRIVAHAQELLDFSRTVCG
ncbi:DUF563 domain-containing protein [Acetobacter oeni]|nr:DUF563 domain-containing protein [Acetobacter oeni]